MMNENSGSTKGITIFLSIPHRLYITLEVKAKEKQLELGVYCSRLIQEVLDGPRGSSYDTRDWSKHDPRIVLPNPRLVPVIGESSTILQWHSLQLTLPQKIDRRISSIASSSVWNATSAAGIINFQTIVLTLLADSISNQPRSVN